MSARSGEDAAEGYEHLMAVSNATMLLIQAARISPPLIEAARLVDLEIHALRDEIDRLRDALLTLRKWDMLALDGEGKGVATADAPWAVALIEGVVFGRTDAGEAG